MKFSQNHWSLLRNQGFRNWPKIIFNFIHVRTSRIFCLDQCVMGYVIAAPRSLREETAFQHLVYKGMLFRAPETGPGRCREPHFRFTSGEPTPDSERTDRRRGRSPGGQEAARKRHRDYKDWPDKLKIDPSNFILSYYFVLSHSMHVC